MSDKHKLSWYNRIKLVKAILLTGKYNPCDYPTMHEVEQWELCRKRQEEMDACTRPKTFPETKAICRYTDYYDENRNY